LEFHVYLRFIRGKQLAEKLWIDQNELLIYLKLFVIVSAK